MADKSILIVGLGLIGGSYAEALTRAGYRVGAVTRSRGSIDYALERGIIADGRTDADPGFVGSFDIVIFALYPHVMLAWIEANQALLKSGALLTDVTGVKRAVIYKVQQMLRPDLEFVGAHPMAGREVGGVRNADSSIFRGANYLVTPTAANSPEAIRTVEQLGRDMGFARISTLSPEEHDEMIGFLSQLTHCLAIALMTCKDNSHMADFTGDSFRDLTRIGRINDEMWSELFSLNADELVSQIDLFEGQLNRLREAIVTGDTATMRDMMRLSTERRALFDKKI